MMGSRSRKVFRDVWARKSRTVLTSTAIFVGVVGVVSLWSSDMLNSQLRQDLKEDELAMQQAYVSAPGEAVLENADYLNTFASFPGIERIEGRANVPLSWKLPDDTRFSKGFVIANWDPFDQVEIQPASLIKGQYPVTGRQELAIETRMAGKYGLKVGDRLELRVLTGEAEVQSWTITGIVYSPHSSFVGGDSLIPPDASVFTTFQDARVITGTTGLSVFYVRYVDFATAQQQVDAFYSFISRETPYVAVFNLVDNPADSVWISRVTEITDLIAVLGIIAMLVSGFLVVNIINAVVGEQRRQIGVMKALGATRWDNVRMYVGIALVYGIIGTVPGVIVGAFLGAIAAQTLDDLTPVLVSGFSISTTAVAIGILLGLAVPVLAALIPVMMGTRVSILEAMTDTGISGQSSKGFLTRVIGTVPMPVTVRQAFINLSRKKGRLALTWITLMLALAAFMGVYAVFASLNDKFSNLFSAYGYDAVVIPNERREFDQIQPLLEGVEGIEAVFAGINLAVDIEGYVSPEFDTSQLMIAGFDPQTDSFRLDLNEGSGWRNAPDRPGIVLTTGVAEQLNKSLGDRVVLAAQGQTAEIEIIGIASFPFDQGFMNWRDLASLVGSTVPGGQVAPTQAMLRLSGGTPNANRVDDVIDLVEERLLLEGISASYINQVEFENDVAQRVTIIGLLFEIAAIVMASVGAIGLLSTLSMAVFERQREIGVMRSIGASSYAVAFQFLTEGMVVGVTAWLVAAPLSYLLAIALIGGLPFGIEGISYAPIALVIGGAGVMAITVLASLGPSMSAARKTVANILRYQ